MRSDTTGNRRGFLVGSLAVILAPGFQAQVAETEQAREIPGTRTVGDFDVGNLVGRLKSVP